MQIYTVLCLLDYTYIQKRSDTLRLQKYLALCGVASRRKCEEYILQGKVRINEEIIRTLGTQVDPEKDTVKFCNEVVSIENKIYIAFYKPAHVICSNNDPQKRKSVKSYFKEIQERLYTIGRLDFDSEGIILVTNDGELANKLMHPRYKIEKQYYAICKGELMQDAADELQQGAIIDGVKTAPAKIHVHSYDAKKGQTSVRVVLKEGRNRQVRKMFESIGHEVLFLKRESFAKITLEGLKSGSWRYLSNEEVKRLYDM